MIFTSLHHSSISLSHTYHSNYNKSFNKTSVRLRTTIMRKRQRPPKPALFDETALIQFLIDHKSPEPKKVASVIYRVAVQCLRNLPAFDDSLETKDTDSTLVQRSIQLWIRNTRQNLLRRRDVLNQIANAVCNDMAFLTTTLIKSVDSEDGNTSKLLVETHDGHRVEAVVLRRHGRNTSICVSSQVGCQMGCQFCATGTMGMIANLTGSEILEQVVYHKLAPSSLRNFPLRNIIFMGMGEPLDNFTAVKAAVDGLLDFSRFGLSRARVTVSTVGVVPSMLKLNKELPGIPLALSLHAPNQTLREQIVPAAKAWPLNSLMSALDQHIYNAQHNNDGIKFTGVMIEYVLLSGINDLPKHAVQLAKLLKGKPVLINLIPYNPNITAEMYGFKAGTYDDAYAFGKILIDAGLHARVRIERGSDIAAACGQLALTSRKGVQKEMDGEDGGGSSGSGSTLTVSAVRDIEDLLGGLQKGKIGSRNNSSATSIASSRASGKWGKRRRARAAASSKEENWDTGSNWTVGSQPQMNDRDGARIRHEKRLQLIEELEQKEGKTLTWNDVENMMGGSLSFTEGSSVKKEKQVKKILQEEKKEKTVLKVVVEEKESKMVIENEGVVKETFKNSVSDTSSNKTTDNIYMAVGITSAVLLLAQYMWRRKK